MRVIETHNIFSAITSLTLDSHEFFRVDVVSVMGGISTSVTATRSASHCLATIVFELTEQHTTALVRISFFTVFPNGFVIGVGNFEHSDCS